MGHAGQYTDLVSPLLHACRDVNARPTTSTQTQLGRNRPIQRLRNWADPDRLAKPFSELALYPNGKAGSNA